MKKFLRLDVTVVDNILGDLETYLLKIGGGICISIVFPDSDAACEWGLFWNLCFLQYFKRYFSFISIDAYCTCSNNVTQLLTESFLIPLLVTNDDLVTLFGTFPDVWVDWQVNARYSEGLIYNAM